VVELKKFAGLVDNEWESDGRSEMADDEARENGNHEEEGRGGCGVHEDRPVRGLLSTKVELLHNKAVAAGYDRTKSQ
jgi:hypothetical protein